MYKLFYEYHWRFVGMCELHTITFGMSGSQLQHLRQEQRSQFYDDVESLTVRNLPPGGGACTS